MMIKINLLPTKRKTPKKVTELQQQMILGVLILIIVGIGIGYLWVALNNRIAGLQRDKAAAEARIREQDNMLREVNNVEDERKKVMDKIDIIEQLKKNQAGAGAAPRRGEQGLAAGSEPHGPYGEFRQRGPDGDAFTNNDVVRFVDNLKASPFLADVFLLETRQAAQEGIEFYKYQLQFRYKGL